MANSPTPLNVVAAALLADDGTVLMQQRPCGKAHAGLWEFPGGKVEAGEGAADALSRELLEELGIRVAPGTFTFVAEARSADGALVISLFAASAWSGRPEALEGGKLAWVACDAVAALDMPPLDYPLAAALDAWRSKKGR